MLNQETIKPFVLTIFGASGDLAKLKIFPSLYVLIAQDKLPKEFYIIGYARTEKQQEEFRKEFRQSILAKYEDADLEIINKLIDKVSYVSGQYDNVKSYQKLHEKINTLSKHDNFLKIHYLSVPPTVFKDIIKNLGSFPKKIKDKSILIIEKPFGGDVISAKALYYFIVQFFKEEQIYLLDHYLGKQPVRSVLHLRHHNRILNSMLKGKEVSDIQITAIEDIGIENRVGYFDQVGIIRDMIQSHLLQILSLVTMSIPITERASSVHREKQSILEAVKFYGSQDHLTLGQYRSYRSLKDVSKGSNTETFAAIKLYIDRESWYKVPIYIRTGKKMHKKYTSIVITLAKFDYQKKHEEPNRVIFELYPNEKISITLLNKFGETSFQKLIAPEHSLTCDNAECLPEHAMLLLEAIKKERRYFLSFPEIISSWQVVGDIFDYIKKQKIVPEIYRDDTAGPHSQHDITPTDGNHWFDLYQYNNHHENN